MIKSRKDSACDMRQKGMSISQIAAALGAAKSSVSTWTRDVVLPYDVKLRLKKNSHSAEVVEKRRQSRLSSELVKRDAVLRAARQSVPLLSMHDLWLIGTMLYWAEGGKTQRTVRFSNGDPEMIRVMMRYFREVCEAEEHKIRGHIHIHHHLDVKQAEIYWSKITGVPISRFYKTYNKPNISSKSTRNTLPYGVFDIYVTKPSLFIQIQGWTLEIAAQLNSTDNSKRTLTK